VCANCDLGLRARPAVDVLCLQRDHRVTGWSLLDRIAAHLPIATATVVILAVRADMGMISDAIVMVVATQLGYVGFALAMAQRAVST
jgi:hypothetical protein